MLAEERETALKLYQVDVNKARKQSFAEGKAEILLALLERKFRRAPTSSSSEGHQASEVELASLLDRLLAASSLQELFGA